MVSEEIIHVRDAPPKIPIRLGLEERVGGRDARRGVVLPLSRQLFFERGVAFAGFEAVPDIDQPVRDRKPELVLNVKVEIRLWVQGAIEELEGNGAGDEHLGF